VNYSKIIAGVLEGLKKQGFGPLVAETNKEGSNYTSVDEPLVLEETVQVKPRLIRRINNVKEA
jgi:hypothetical protein